MSLTLVLALTVTLALDSLERGGAICSDEAVRTFYEQRGDAPAWDEQNAGALRRAIARAADEALDPQDYPLPASDRTPEERDVLLSDAFLTYATHLLRGRENPQFDWCSAPRDLDLAAILESALIDRTIEEVLPQLAPRHEGYRKLRQAWQVYRAMVDWREVPPGASLRLGDRGTRVEQLRERLGLSGSESFDGELEAAVRDFQRRHGLVEDGIAGPKTLTELNVPRQARLRQLGWNLERWRWMPDDLGERHLLVNVAAFDATLVENGTATLRMRIVAGKDLTRTPFFTARVEAVTVNPPWNVPDSIASGELWPKQRRDRSYFAREHIRVLPGGRLRQDPGPWCALGRIKLEMPNRYNVYLHDTPARSLFATDLRAFSHGCIRMEKPVDMAAALTGRSAGEIENLIAAERQVTITLEQKIPVYVLYWTAFVGDDGEAEFRRDVYGQDAAMEAARTARP